MQKGALCFPALLGGVFPELSRNLTSGQLNIGSQDRLI